LRSERGAAESLIGSRIAADPSGALSRFRRVAIKVEPSLILAGCRCVPQRLLAEGFVFRHPNLAPALRDLLTSPHFQRAAAPG
jgi:hypothetical protein